MKTYRFSILKDDSTYYAILGKSVITQANPYYLEYSPDGWSETEINFARNKKYFGCMQSYSTPYKFVLDGAKILYDIFTKQGIDGVASLKVEYYNASQRAYEILFISGFDFTTSVVGRDDFEITLIERGVAAMFKSKETTEFEIPMYNIGDDILYIDIPPFLVQGKAKWLSSYPSTNIDAFFGATAMANLLVDSSYVGTPIYASPNTDGGLSLIKANQDIYNARITGEVYYYLGNQTSGTSSTDINYEVQLKIGGTIYVLKHHLIAAGDDVTDHVTFDMQFNLPAGQFVYLIITSDGPGNAPGTIAEKIVWESGRAINFTFYYYTPEFTVRGMRYHTLTKKLLAKMTNDTAVASSNYFTANFSPSDNIDSVPRNLIIISETSIRGIEASGYTVPSIKTTFDKHFKAGNCIYNTGLDIAGPNVSIERKANFFNKDLIIADLGEVASLEVSYATDHLFNQINIGYEPKEYEQLNGLDEFNSTQTYTLPFTMADNELDLVSPYGLDMYGIFYAWALYNFLDDKNADSAYNNDVFAVQIDPNPKANGHYQPLRIAPKKPITGLTDPSSAFNMGESPKRNLLRHGNYLRACAYGKDSSKITYQTSDKNADLDSYFSIDVVEKSDVPIASLAAPLFKPFIFKIEVESPRNYIQLMLTKRNGCFQFTYKGKQYKGFPIETGVRPKKPILFNFKLLCTPDSDFPSLH